MVRTKDSFNYHADVLVSDKHQFKNEQVMYRFRYDDGTYKPRSELEDIVSKVCMELCDVHQEVCSPSECPWPVVWDIATDLCCIELSILMPQEMFTLGTRSNLAMNNNTVVTVPKTADCNPNRVTKGLKTVGGNMSAANLSMMVHGG